MSKYRRSRIRHIVKAITWRIIASLTTFLLAFFFFQHDPNAGEKATYVAVIESVVKLIFYYYHERIWFKVKKITDHRKRHLIKTLTWRGIATSTTFTIAFFIFKGDPKVGELAGLIAVLDIFVKMALYYAHEEVWYRVNFGLEDREHE